MIRHTIPTAMVLEELLDADPGDCYAARLAGRVGVTPTTTGRIIDRMVAVGWVTTAWVSTTPGRPPRRMVTVTERGRSEIPAWLGIDEREAS